MSWREYIGRLSDSERHELLEVILENEEAIGCSQYRYREAIEDEDESCEECIYWEATGEPLIERYSRDDWVVAVDGDWGDVFDADGNDINWVVRANLKTGWCECLQVDENGDFVTDTYGYGTAKVTKTYPAPLRFERIER